MRLIDADAFDKCLEGAEIEATKNQKYVFSSAINTIRGNLANAPTIELQKWIPVSESKPGFPCIVSDAHGNISTPYGIIGLSDIEHGKWYVDARNDRNEIINGQPASLLCWENRIVAWMPLPEPYKEEQHD